MNDYNYVGAPCAYFDGGYKVELGAGPGVKATFIQDINYCGARDVHDLLLDVGVHWLGNATMEISVVIENIDSLPDDFEGHLRVFVTEIESSMGWKNSAGELYRFPFLDYAFNESVTISHGSTWQGFATWDGHLYNSGHGQSFGTITQDNIMVMAVVFNDEWHQGYSDPWGHTGLFDAYHVDEAESAVPETLWTDVHTVSETGGIVNISLSADESNAGRKYLLVGGATGTEPGTALPNGMVLPVNWDAFSDLVMGLLNTTVFSNFLATLDANGQSSAQINVPPLPPGNVGTVMYYSYCLNNPFDFVSNPVMIEIVP